MTTPSGQIGLSDVNAELGFSPTALISMNDSAVRTLAGVGGSGTIISMNDLRGKTNRTIIPLTISSNSYNYDVYTNRGPTYIPGNSDITVSINPGIVVGSTTTGTYALLVPNAFSPADTVTIVNNGTIIGRGGNGGNGGSGNNPATPGSPGNIGGNALYVNRPTTITNNGTIAGGGGGGGGGGGTFALPSANSRRGGGGGGGGAGLDGGTGGTGGPASFPGTPGNNGTVPAGGSGGPGGTSPTGSAGSGGTGGGQGASGLSGSPSPQTSGGGAGGAGAYIVGLPFVTWPATGTRLGPSS